jgi:hypothetical protein
MNNNPTGIIGCRDRRSRLRHRNNRVLRRPTGRAPFSIISSRSSRRPATRYFWNFGRLKTSRISLATSAERQIVAFDLACRSARSGMESHFRSAPTTITYPFMIASGYQSTSRDGKYGACCRQAMISPTWIKMPPPETGALADVAGETATIWNYPPADRLTSAAFTLNQRLGRPMKPLWVSLREEDVHATTRDHVVNRSAVGQRGKAEPESRYPLTVLMR